MRGLKPVFDGLDYIQVKEVYGVSDFQYGYITFVASFTFVVSIVLYNRFFKHLEMRFLYFIATLFKVALGSLE